ncbi:hypothetical protein M441DRAFT_62893 [Trichoderma asperellum CBS 433.97]|uniref:Uncharacterized protein n=1 Tax=Trichoderma asperellum (strain ATCC 204424 / CBS 433.97 / NBRC 101777) TaxID=1042311 RepID=A0A2T3YRS1_TRIA4|nr:hypothetical protein M441DRAFT_62893 [Trichoderma asperellum CBS 433.97]PTB35268.1 hypothetical protein M441DRAFT_62893 [Trichoderma asperellum CBS 433.97]
MTAVMDPPVIRELAAILKGIDYPLNFNDPNFRICRALTKDKDRCKNRIAQKKNEVNEVNDLLSQFRAMTKCVDTNDFYDDMQRFISLTHCANYHREEALAALNRWKVQRKAAISSSRPVTPPRSATSYNDSFESVYNSSSMGPPISPPSVKSARPRILISESPDIIASQLHSLLGEPPLGGLGGKGDGTFIETTQEIYRSESREVTPEGDYKVFVEIKKIRTKLSQTNIKEDSKVDEQTNIKEDSQVDEQTNIKEDSKADEQTNIKEDSKADECSGPTVSDVKGKEQRNRKYWISKAKNKLGFKSPRPESLETLY